MKKIALLLLFAIPLVFATACGDDKDELEYLDPALIEGTWLWEDGSLLHYAVYKNNTCKEFTIEKYTGFRSSEYFYTKYQITKDRIYRIRNGKTYSFLYILEENSILYDKLNNIKYIKVAPLE